MHKYIQEQYGVSSTVTNVSLGGNTSYAGYVSVMNLNDDVNYDLAVICYGQNDQAEGLGTNYEAIIYALQSKYPDCSIISILESSQREYTNKIQVIQSICAHYGIPTVDTIKAFSQDYDSLSDDGIHPNDAGQTIYYETIKKIIDENVNASTGKMSAVQPINDLSKYQNFIWYGIGSDSTGGEGFEQIDDTTFVLQTHMQGMFGIDYTYKSGDNKADIYIDGTLYTSPTMTFDYDFSQRHILVVEENCTVTSEIKIVFADKEQADGFSGMCFSGPLDSLT